MTRLTAYMCAQVIKKQLAEGVTHRRVGLVSTGPPPRAHSPILNAEGKEVCATPSMDTLLCMLVSCRASKDVM